MRARQRTGLSSHSRTRTLAAAISTAVALGGTPAHAITVYSNDDDAASMQCTLRTALAVAGAASAPGPCVLDAPNDNLVRFDASLKNSTITLQQGQLAINTNTLVIGSGQTIDANHASRAILINSAEGSFSDVTITGGSADSGGGIALNVSAGGSGLLQLLRVNVRGNAATFGGGIHAAGNATVDIRNSVITGNTASFGGGMSAFGIPTLNVSDSTISDNSVHYDQNHYCAGGGIYAARSSLTIGYSAIAGNVADGCTNNNGGGIYAYGSSLLLLTSTLANNHATSARNVAGALLFGGRYAVNIDGSTIAANVATTSSGTGIAAGGVLASNGFASTLAIRQTILATNSASAAAAASPTPDLAVSPAAAWTVDAQYSLFGTALGATLAGNHNIFSDAPGLGPLQDNGGATKTMALLPGSAAIDAAGTQAVTVHDQREYTRVINNLVDIGAFEFLGDRLFADGFGG